MKEGIGTAVKTTTLRDREANSARLKRVRERLQSLIPPQSSWTQVDEALYGVEDLFRVDKSKAENLRFEALRHSFEHHYELNAFYRQYCRGEGVSPAEIGEPSDLARIPLIPDTFFKDHPLAAGFFGWLQRIATGPVPDIDLKGANASFDDVIEALQERDFTVTFTSGTSGKFSFFPRDALTWMRQQYSYACGVAEILGSHYDSGLAVLILAPNPEKTHLFLGRVTGFAYGTLFDRDNVIPMVDRKLTTDAVRIATGRTKGVKEWAMARVMRLAQRRTVATLAGRLEGYAAGGRKALVVGPPAALSAVLSTLQERGKRLALGNNGFVLTGGGWKVMVDSAIPEQEFRGWIERILGVPDEHCRDLYGMSECSSPFPACEGHYKHVPHTVIYPFVLDDDLKPLGYAEYGRFAFLDALPNSYPGFIITGDRVRMLESCPVCDRKGPVIEPDICRIGGVEDRGCGGILRQLVGKGMPQTT